MSRRRLFPTKPHTRAIRQGIGAEVAGILILSVTLFTRVPLVMALSIPIGTILILAGLMAWLRGVLRAP